MTRVQARAAVGGFSEPGKMPCYGWSISARKCNVGSRLAAIPGTVCHKCYARKGRYVFPNVQAALSRRLAAYEANPREWAANMVAALEGETHFRWFDSGDLQSLEMLERIVDIAKARPEVKFWLPTKEAFLVWKWRKANGEFPANLAVRVSLPKVEMLPRDTVHVRGALPMAGVSRREEEVTCPAKSQGGRCLDCRKCWTREDVVYAAH